MSARAAVRMGVVADAIRLLLTAALVVGVFVEAGPWTGWTVGLLALAGEINGWLLTKHGDLIRRTVDLLDRTHGRR